MFESIIRRNRYKSFFLLILISSILASLVYFLSLYFGYSTYALLIAGLVSIIAPFISYYHSDKIVIRSSGAVDADEIKYKQLHNIVEELALSSGLPKPRVMIVDDIAPNAFATGRDEKNGVIAVTTGLLEKMDRDELEGVIGHELAHIANKDILVGTIAAAFAGLIMSIVDISLRFSFSSNDRRSSSSPLLFIGLLLAFILAPLAALIIQATISRKRESLADATSISFTRNPDGMRRALLKLASDNTEVKKISYENSALWIEGANPKSKTLTFINKLFSTHPPIADRIKAIDEIEGIN